MNTLEKQLQGIIQNSVSKTMNIKIPLQENTEDRNLLLQVLKAQVKIQEDIKRIQFVKCMRAAGLEISFLKRYLQLFEGGDKTVKERREILVEQRKILKEKLDAMQEAYNRLNYKIDLYDKNILDKNLM